MVIGIAAMNIYVQAFHVDIFSLPLNIVALNFYIYILPPLKESLLYFRPHIFSTKLHILCIRL